MKKLFGGRKRKGSCTAAFAAAIIAVTAAAVTGCGVEDKDVKEPNLSTWNPGDLDRGERVATPVPEGWAVADGFRETEQESGRMVEAQILQDRSISEGDGYYYIYDDNDRKIYSVEETTGEVSVIYEVPYLQNEQTDDTETGMKVYESDEMWKPGFKLQAYDGCLYVSAYDQAQGGYREGNYDDWPLYRPARAALYRIEDGKLQEVLCLADREEYSFLSFDYLIYEGYVYYWYDIYTRENSFDTWGEGNNCIWRVPLGGPEEEAECVYAWQGNVMKSSGNADVKTLAPCGDYLYFVDSAEETKYLYRIVISEKCLERIPLDEEGRVVQLVADADRVYYGTDDMRDQGADAADSQQGWKQMSFAADAPLDCISLSDSEVVFYKEGFWYLNYWTGSAHEVDVYDWDFKLISRITGITLKASGKGSSGMILAEGDNGLLALAEKKDFLIGKPNLRELREIKWNSWMYYDEDDYDYFYSEGPASSDE